MKEEGSVSGSFLCSFHLDKNKGKSKEHFFFSLSLLDYIFPPGKSKTAVRNATAQCNY